MGGHLMLARKNGKPTLRSEQAEALAREVREASERTSEEAWKRFEDAIMHGTTEQRQARTRAAVRANLAAANKEDT